MQPLKLGPKTFKTPEELYRYFSRLLTEQTMEQNINEVWPIPVHRQYTLHACLHRVAPRQRAVGDIYFACCACLVQR